MFQGLMLQRRTHSTQPNEAICRVPRNRRRKASLHWSNYPRSLAPESCIHLMMSDRSYGLCQSAKKIKNSSLSFSYRYDLRIVMIGCKRTRFNAEETRYHGYPGDCFAESKEGKWTGQVVRFRGISCKSRSIRRLAYYPAAVNPTNMRLQSVTIK